MNGLAREGAFCSLCESWHPPFEHHRQRHLVCLEEPYTHRWSMHWAHVDWWPLFPRQKVAGPIRVVLIDVDHHVRMWPERFEGVLWGGPVMRSGQ